MHDQTQQLNKIEDDLNAIEFTMNKASKVIADIGKGIMTDRCVGSDWVGSLSRVYSRRQCVAATPCKFRLDAGQSDSPTTSQARPHAVELQDKHGPELAVLRSERNMAKGWSRGSYQVHSMLFGHRHSKHTLCVLPDEPYKLPNTPDHCAVGPVSCRCIMFLLFLVVCGVIALVVVKVVKPNAAAISAVVPDSVANFAANATSAVQNVIPGNKRRLSMVQQLGQQNAQQRQPAMQLWRHLVQHEHIVAQWQPAVQIARVRAEQAARWVSAMSPHDVCLGRLVRFCAAAGADDSSPCCRQPKPAPRGL